MATDIGVVMYLGSGISRGVILRNGENNATVIGEGQENDLERIIKTVYPEIVLYRNAYAFSQECEKLGADCREAIKRKERVLPVPKFAQWEQVKCIHSLCVIEKIIDISSSGIMYGLRDNLGIYHAKYEDDLEKTVQVLPAQEVVFNYEIQPGKIVDYHGQQYRSVSSTYISAREAANLEDGWDEFDTSGWHTKAILVSRDQDG